MRCTRGTGQWCTRRNGRWKLYLPNTSWFVFISGLRRYGVTNLHILDQVKAGTVDESDIDAAVATMLRTKFALGLFESRSCLRKLTCY